MLYSIRGKLIHIDLSFAVIECGGVGFHCRVTATTARSLPALGEEAMLYTIMNVREDAIELFGFSDQNELRFFKQLTSVSGVGPKAAVSVLSELSPEKVALAVAGGDYRTITRANGVGPKLAQRIVLELKDKVAALSAEDTGFVPSSSAPAGTGFSAAKNAAEAVEALSMLGFTPGEASSAVGRLDENLPVEQLVRDALKSLAGSAKR